MPLYNVPAPALHLGLPTIAAPTTAPSGFSQSTSFASSTSPSGGISAGWVSNTAILYRCRYVGKHGWSAPGPSSVSYTVNTGSVYVKMSSMPAASSDAGVIGLLLERSKDGGTTWLPIFTDADSLYTVPNGALAYADETPDADLGAALPMAGDGSGGAVVQPLGVTFVGAANTILGDAYVPQLPDHPWALLTWQLAQPGGAVFTLVSPLYRLGS